MHAVLQADKVKYTHVEIAGLFAKPLATREFWCEPRLAHLPISVCWGIQMETPCHFAVPQLISSPVLDL